MPTLEPDARPAVLPAPGCHERAMGPGSSHPLPNPTGPGLTRQGHMWLDAETGFVLAYAGRTGLGREQRWEVRQLRYGPQPAELFEPPGAAR